MRIGWIRTEKARGNQIYGGSIYNEYARNVLAKHFDLETIPIQKDSNAIPSYLDTPKLFWALLTKLKGHKDIWVRDYFSIITLPFDRTRGKNIALIHHIDSTSLPSSLKFIFSIFENIFYHNLKKVDAIVTISSYWQNHFIKRGYKKVYKIYNPIDFDNYQITDIDVENF